MPKLRDNLLRLILLLRHANILHLAQKPNPGRTTFQRADQDLNPIEQLIAKLKHLMRAAEQRTVETTWRQAGAILDLVSPAECGNYLVNSGYASV